LLRQEIKVLGREKYGSGDLAKIKLDVEQNRPLDGQ
jgi:hypothetical protein